MGTKVTRKSREKLSQKVDLLEPLPLSIFEMGGPKDPCFGKYNDPNAQECRKCGDCEICSIVQAQKVLLPMRKKVEEQMAFKDLEEEKIEKMTRRQKFNLLVLDALKDKNPITLTELKERALVGLNIKEARFEVYLTKLVSRKKQLTTKNNQLHKA